MSRRFLMFYIYNHWNRLAELWKIEGAGSAAMMQNTIVALDAAKMTVCRNTLAII
jgi:hypothetical protein